MRKLDRFLIDAVQSAYLWIYDRTGLCVGTLVLVLPVLAVVISGDAANWFMFTYLSLMALISWVYYHDQVSGNIARFNLRAEANRKSWLRPMFNVLVSYGLVEAVLRASMAHFVGEIVWLTFSYVVILQIRKREPPEKYVFATQGASS